MLLCVHQLVADDSSEARVAEMNVDFGTKDGVKSCLSCIMPKIFCGSIAT